MDNLRTTLCLSSPFKSFTATPREVACHVTTLARSLSSPSRRHLSWMHIFALKEVLWYFHRIFGEIQLIIIWDDGICFRYSYWLSFWARLPAIYFLFAGTISLYCGKWRKISKLRHDLDHVPAMPNIKLVWNIFIYYGLLKFHFNR